MFSFCQKKISVDLCGCEKYSNKKPFNFQQGKLVNRQFPCFFSLLSTILRDVEKVCVVLLIIPHSLCVFFLTGHLYQRFQLAGLLQRYSFQCRTATTQRTWRKKEMRDYLHALCYICL